MKMNSRPRSAFSHCLDLLCFDEFAEKNVEREIYEII